jgi:hypothetical protein
MSDPRLASVQRKTRRRLVFTAIHLALYFTFTLNWTQWGAALSRPIGGGLLSGAIVMFIVLVLVFIGLEFLFLSLDKRQGES